MGLIDKKLGRSIYFLHTFTEVVKARKESESFEELLKVEVTIH